MNFNNNVDDSHSTHSSEEDKRNLEIKIYVNGEILHRKEAKISVYDSGFMLGDGMWEGMRLVQGIWIFFEEHMDRLFSSCHAVGIDIGLDRDGILKVLNDTANANNITTDAHCRLMVTRGIKDKPFQHPNLSNSGPSLVIIIEHSKPDMNLKSEGISLATVPQIRGLPMSQDPKYNSHSKLNCVLACLQAEQAGAQEGLMLDPNGFINTTNACNFFIVLDNEVWTSTGDYCMKGITRQKIIDICYKNSNYIAVASRVKRRENIIFKILYKSHLILTFLFQLKDQTTDSKTFFLIRHFFLELHSHILPLNYFAAKQCRTKNH